MEDLTKSAFLFALHMHGDQKRKESDIPYVSHLMAVAAMVMEHTQDQDVIAAAFLHDVIEDQSHKYKEVSLERIIIERFNGRVLSLVQELSETNEDPKPPWMERKIKYLSHMNNASMDAALIAICDKIHNARSTLADLRSIGDKTWDKFNGDKESQIWWYTSLKEIFNERDDISDSLKWEFSDLVHNMFYGDWTCRI